MGNDAIATRCVECKFAMPESIFKKTLDEEEFKRYQKYLRKSFVDLCPEYKWCPEKGCELAVENMTGENIDVMCDCGKNYCFGCYQDPHFPINCGLLGDWKEQTDEDNEQDAATKLYLKSQSKPCPKCGAACMLAGGCNWVTCQACRYGFCFLCMGGVDCHEFPAGYGHPIQCDSIEDVKKKGRLDKMYDPSADVETMERLKAHLEKFATKYRYHKEMNRKHSIQLKVL